MAEELQLQLSRALRQASEKESELDGLRRMADEAMGRAKVAMEAADASADDVRAAKDEVAKLEADVHKGRLELAEAKRQGLGQASELQKKVCWEFFFLLFLSIRCCFYLPHWHTSLRAVLLFPLVCRRAFARRPSWQI